MYLLKDKKVLIILDSIEKRGENLELLLLKFINRCKSVYILTTSSENLRFNDLNPSYYQLETFKDINIVKLFFKKAEFKFQQIQEFIDLDENTKKLLGS